MKQLQKAQEVVKSMKGELIGFAPESTTLLHLEDYLFIVLAAFEHKNEYTVWLYNAEFEGMYNGYYTNNYNDAINEFKRRINR